jgi:hypothetical protein
MRLLGSESGVLSIMLSVLWKYADSGVMCRDVVIACQLLIGLAWSVMTDRDHR